MSQFTRSAAIWLLLLASAGGIGKSFSAEIRNSASATLGGRSLDASRATIRLDRAASAVSSALAEIQPSSVLRGSVGNRLVYDILPTIGPLDSGIKYVDITVPAGYGGVAVQDVRVKDAALR